MFLVRTLKSSDKINNRIRGGRLVYDSQESKTQKDDKSSVF